MSYDKRSSGLSIEWRIWSHSSRASFNKEVDYMALECMVYCFIARIFKKIHKPWLDHLWYTPWPRRFTLRSTLWYEVPSR